MNLFYPVLLGVGAFIAVFYLIPVFGDYLKKKGVVGVDVNKEKKQRLPENGGLLVVAVVLLAYSLYAILSNKFFLLVNAYAVALVSLFGLLDYYRHFRPKQKIFVPLLIGFILAPAVYPAASTPFGSIYAPLALTVLFILAFPVFSNLTNMLAGFNGIEAGLSAIASLSLAVIALLFSSPDAFVFSFILFSALSAFWLYNRYPARIFPGDSLTLSCGAALTLIAFQSGLEFYLPLLLLPHIADALLKFASAGIMSREDFKPVQVRRGRLFVGRNTYLSVCRLFLLQGALAEQELVKRVLLLGLASAALAVMVAYGGVG